MTVQPKTDVIPVYSHVRYSKSQFMITYTLTALILRKGITQGRPNHT
jgi:hypothetical protein